jgi:N-acetylglucosamine-6-phosphate deacetylase
MTQEASATRAYVGGQVLQGRHLESATVVVADSKIVEVLAPDAPIGSAARIDVGGRIVAPGFVDTHVHGALGQNVMSASPDALSTIAHALASQGTTSFVAATASVDAERLHASLDGLAGLTGTVVEGGARLLGSHLEGPFISPARAGVHRTEFLLEPTESAVAAMLEAARGTMRVCTVAPELPGGMRTITQLADAGVVPSVGHTDADFDLAARAVDAGARRATHLWNAMPPLHHREPGAVAALLADDRVRPEVVADGIHVSPQLLATHFLIDSLAERMMIVSDGVDVTGLPDGEHRRWEGTRVVLRDGVSRTPDGVIAGSTATMLTGVRTLVAAGVRPADALHAASTSPADSLGMDRIGRITPGADADMVFLDADLTLRSILIRGELLHT